MAEAKRLGEKRGYRRAYFENGKTQRLVRYLNNEKHGKQYRFNEYGDTLSVEAYKNGEKIE
ncbi:MAG: hypothetical protein ACFB0B_16730 [Thermonemataceae bacterium]